MLSHEPLMILTHSYVTAALGAVNIIPVLHCSKPSNP